MKNKVVFWFLNNSKSRAFIANRYPAALGHDQTTSSNPIVNIENNNGKVDGHPKAGSSNIKKRNEVGKDQESATKNQSLCDGIGYNADSGVLMKGVTVGEHWDPWLRQMGYPFLTVKYTDDNTKGKVS